MLVTLLGIVTEVKPEPLKKARFPMLVTLLGITKSLTSSPTKYKRLAYVKGFALGSSNSILHHVAKSVIWTDVKPEQFANAFSPMLFTLLGIVTEVKPSQAQKAFLPILVTLSGICKSVISTPFRYK